MSRLAQLGLVAAATVVLALYLALALLPVVIVSRDDGWLRGSVDAIRSHPMPWTLLAVVAPLVGNLAAIQRLFLGSWDAPFFDRFVPAATYALTFGVCAAVTARAFTAPEPPAEAMGSAARDNPFAT